MVTLRSFFDLQKAMRAKSNKLKKTVMTQIPSNAATYTHAVAQAHAPRQRNETFAGITKSRVKAGHYRVESVVTPKGRTGFMQNFWANRTPPFRSVRMIGWPRYRGMDINKVPGTIYGDGSHNFSGTPGFFDLAATEGRKKFNKLMINGVRTALKVTI